MVNYNNTTSRNGGIGFIGALTLLFIGLKLSNIITWSWWWVLSPIWGSFIFWFIFFFVAIIYLWVSAKR